MPRPKLCRCVRFCPRATYFKPRGVPMSCLEVVTLSMEEAEALRLKNVVGLSQIEAAKEMKTSQSTFARLLSVANKKVSKAIIEGTAIEIE